MDHSDEPAGIGHNQPPSTLEVMRTEFAGLCDEVEVFAKEATDLRESLKEGQIDFADTEGREAAFEKVVEIGKRSQKMAKTLDETRLTRTQPLRDEVAEINKFFAMLTGRIDKIKAFATSVAGEYNRRVREEEARQAAEAARRAEEEARRKLEEAAAASHSVMSDVLMEEAAQAEQLATKAAAHATKAGTGPTRAASGTVSTSKTFDFRIEDIQKIPPAMIVAQMSVTEIEKAIRAHVRKFKDAVPVPGVKIFPTEKSSFR